ncbi:hypothetical protein RFI_34176 [Reticulomyxa filosa]|uniref:Uncharacterized protein n=1 Tax=Reticulomyxa filosa TaxID=46433 RepID=X6LMR0_RETFI|nr:hypothetical protein RFI_34176 [Reticulomyxa filosa]|eukprot:ETO03233.1 hypothetical protein RFI_34176 [Reticulomyxa filosa]
MQRVNKRSKLNKMDTRKENRVTALNDFMEERFVNLGLFVGTWPYACLLGVVAVCVAFTIGLTYFSIITDVFDLWTPRSSLYYGERKFYDKEWANYDADLIAIACRHKDGYEDILDSKYVAEYFDLHLHLVTTSPRKTFQVSLANGTKLDFVFSLFGGSTKQNHEYIYI